MNAPDLGELVDARGLEPFLGLRGDAVRAVEVLVDMLDDVGDPQLGEYVVGRVLVDLAGALRRLQPGVEAGRTGRRRRRIGRVCAQPRTIGSAGVAGPSTASGVTTQ